MTLLAYSEKYLEHDMINHPENAGRIRSIMSFLENASILKSIKQIEPQPVSEDDILKIHSKEMMELVKKLSKSGGWIDFDTYVCLNSFEIAKLAAGGVLELAKRIVDGEDNSGFAVVRPPGHHATKYRSMGFCLFNNVALAAKLMEERGLKVLIFDHDVHHGNGTQDIFYDDPNVMYQSFHLSPHYPGTGDIDEIGKGGGEGYTLNLPLPRGAGDETVMRAMEEVFLPVAEEFKPDLIIVSAGFDSHYEDPLGGLRLCAESYYNIIKRLMDVKNRIICSLEGGYNLNNLGRLVLSEIRAMMGRDIDYTEGIKEARDASERIEELKRKMSEYWNLK